MDIDEGAWPAYLDEGMPPLYGVASPYSCGEFEAQMQLPPLAPWPIPHSHLIQKMLRT